MCVESHNSANAHTSVSAWGLARENYCTQTADLSSTLRTRKRKDTTSLQSCLMSPFQGRQIKAESVARGEGRIIAHHFRSEPDHILTAAPFPANNLPQPIGRLQGQRCGPSGASEKHLEKRQSCSYRQTTPKSRQLRKEQVSKRSSLQNERAMDGC